MAKVVFLSNVPLGSTFRLGSHHLSRELARRGHDVVHVSTPISRTERLLGREVRSRAGLRRSIPFTDAHRRLANGPYRDDDGVVHDVARPVLPTRWRRSSPTVSSILREGPAADADVVVLDQLLLSDAVDDVDATVIYRSTDVQTSRLGIELEARFVDRADGIVWCSSFSARSPLAQASAIPQLVLENGVEDTFFTASDMPRTAGFVYVGAIDARFDWSAVSALAVAFPDTPIRIAGPVGRRPEGDLPASVELLGSIPYEDVPAFLHSGSVGILPLTTDPMNAGRSPMKFFEYLAAGLRVLATSTPELEARGEVPGVALYRSLAELDAKAASVLIEPPTDNVAGRDFARAFGWQARAEQFEQFMLGLR